MGDAYLDLPEKGRRASMTRWTSLANLTENDLPVSTRTLRRWAQNGKIHAKKIGKKWFVDLDDIAEKNGMDV